MTQFTKSFLWRFILDIILLGIFVRLLQSVILAICQEVWKLMMMLIMYMINTHITISNILMRRFCREKYESY